MVKILVYVETVNGQATETSRELLAGARQLGDAVIAVVVDAEINDLPANEIHQVSVPDVGGYTAQSHLAALKLVAEAVSPDLVMVPNSYVGLDLSAALAGSLNWPMLSYCGALGIDGANVTATCKVYGGKLLADVEAPMPAVAAIAPGTFKADDVSASTAVMHHALQDAGGMKVTAVHEPDNAAVDITQVEKLVCVGRGIGDEDNIDMARELANTLGGEIVASRPVVDLGWLEKSRQVGKSGKAVKPKLYIAFGVSGAPEHLEGMSDSDLIIAVNSDPEAPIFDVAHFGTTCDALDLLPVLTERLKS